MFWSAVFVVIIILIIYYYCIRIGTQTYIFEGMMINVISDKECKEQAIQIMLECNKKMIKLLEHLRKTNNIGITESECSHNCHLWNKKYKEERKIIDHLLRGFNYENIHETLPTNGKDVAYSLNKGQTVMLCLRDIQKNKQPVDINLLMFVIMHESAHIANYSEWGHSILFWSIFKYLIEQAVIIGVYEPLNYAEHPQQYCGFEVKHNPYYEKNIPSLFEYMKK